MRRLGHALFCFFRNAEDFFADDALCGFIEIFVEGTFYFQKLRPQDVVDERYRGTQDNGGIALARITVGC